MLDTLSGYNLGEGILALKANVGRNQAKIEIGLILLDLQSLEEERLPKHLNAHRSDFPITCSYFLEPNTESTAFVQMTEQATIKLDFVSELGVDSGDSFVFAVQQQRPLHVAENLLHTTRRIELGVRCERKRYVVLSHSVVLKAKGGTPLSFR